jgi:hypothetical protein
MGTRHTRRSAAEASNPQGWTAYFQGIDASEGLFASVVPDGRGAPHHDKGVAYRLNGIGYDARADAIAIDVGELATDATFLRYFISSPRSITIDKNPDVTTIEVVDAQGELTHIYVYPEPVTLPREGAGTAAAERDEAGD